MLLAKMQVLSRRISGCKYMQARANGLASALQTAVPDFEQPSPGVVPTQNEEVLLGLMNEGNAVPDKENEIMQMSFPFSTELLSLEPRGLPSHLSVQRR